MDSGGALVAAYIRRARVVPAPRSPSASDVRHGSLEAAVLSRGLRPDPPGALGAGGFCLQAEVLRSDALRLWRQTAGSLGPERLRAPPAVGRCPPEPTTHAGPIRCRGPLELAPDSPGGLAGGGYCL